MATTQDTEQRKPLLDLSDLVDRRDYIIAKDGKQYYLRTDGLGALQHHRLVHCSERHDELFRKDRLSDEEEKETVALLEEILTLVLDAPATVRKQIKGSQARQILRHFQRASQLEEEEVLQRLMMLAGALEEQNQTDLKPDGSSTTES